MKEFNNPKRRKSKDNPYIINYIQNNNTYIVIFKSNNKEEKIQVSKDIYDALNQFELEDLKYLNEKDRHYERLEQTDEFIFKRSFEKHKSLEEEVEEKILNDNIREAINNLSEKQKRRLIKYYFEGKTEQEIALEENATQQSIHIGLQRSIQKLKEILKNYKI